MRWLSQLERAESKPGIEGSWCTRGECTCGTGASASHASDSLRSAAAAPPDKDGGGPAPPPPPPLPMPPLPLSPLPLPLVLRSEMAASRMAGRSGSPPEDAAPSPLHVPPCARPSSIASAAGSVSEAVALAAPSSDEPVVSEEEPAPPGSSEKEPPPPASAGFLLQRLAMLRVAASDPRLGPVPARAAARGPAARGSGSESEARRPMDTAPATRETAASPPRPPPASTTPNAPRRPRLRRVPSGLSSLLWPPPPTTPPPPAAALSKPPAAVLRASASPLPRAAPLGPLWGLAACAARLAMTSCCSFSASPCASHAASSAVMSCLTDHASSTWI